MRVINQVSKFLIFLTILFGIINSIPNGLKNTLRLIYILFIGACLGIYLIKTKRIQLIDYLLILIVLSSSIGLTNYLIDLYNKPVTIAEDCEGHHDMAGQWIKGFLWGPILTIIIGIGYLRFKTEKTTVDRILAMICIIALILSAVKSETTLKISNYINDVSMPILILPEDC